MRRLADRARIRAFLRALGHAAQEQGEVYLTGGATAVLVGWRPTTLDVDLRLEPDADVLLRRIAELKDELDITEMIRRGLVEPARALALFDAIEGELFRYPAIDPTAFRRKVNESFGPVA